MSRLIVLPLCLSLLASPLAASEPVSTSFTLESAPTASAGFATVAADEPAASDRQGYALEPKKKKSTARKIATGAAIALGVTVIGVLGFVGYVSLRCRNNNSCSE